MQKLKIIFILSIIALNISCKKEVETERPEFIGNWFATEYPGSSIYEECIYLDIDKNSYARFTFIYDDTYVHHYSGIARANDKHFKIGRDKYFKIIEYPHEIDTNKQRYYIFGSNHKLKLANWKMVLDGMKPALFYNSGIREYYKADY